MPLPKFIFSRYRYLLSREADSLIKIRIKLLLVCLLAFVGLFTVLSILYVIEEPNFLLVRSISCVFLFSGGLFSLMSFAPWRAVGHFFVICLTLLIWSNVLLFVPGINMVTVQFSVLVLAAAYYILGARWGVTYSLISVLPLIIDMLIENFSDYDFGLRHLAINNEAYVFTGCFNFALLLFIHYSFFRALNKANAVQKRLRTNLQQTLLEAEELSSAKTNFLTTMSHQLRTPLNAVVGMTNILLMENPKPSQKSNLNILRFSAENLMATVNDILDFNKINNEAVVLEKRIFRPEELITNVIDSFKPVAAEKHLKLIYKVDDGLKRLNVVGDPMRLTQILFHLVGNAIKFTEKGFVQLEVKVTAIDTGSVSFHFCVADSGIGIPEELKDKIFEPFTTSLSRTSRQFHSTLGLTIAFHLVKLHEGTLSFESKEGQGTTFEFDISYPISAVAENTEPAKAISAIGGMRVLLVEDEKLNILVIKKILAKWNIMPDVAVDGAQAVKAAASRDYDVILMDINMPVMDGFEASRQIRELPQPGRGGVPIIAVTASIGAAMEQIDKNPHIDDCLLKPFNPEHLREKLMEIAGRKVISPPNPVLKS